MNFVHVWMYMCERVCLCLLIVLMNDYVHNICMFVFVCVGAAEKWDDFAETSKQKGKRKIQTSCTPTQTHTHIHLAAHLYLCSCGDSH